jgi:hypothetical protein
VRLAIVILGLMVFGYSAAQEAKRKTPAKKQAAHSKATPEQIRKFKQLEEKQKK